jgi:hypothetical protein
LSAKTKAKTFYPKEEKYVIQKQNNMLSKSKIICYPKAK